MTIDDKPHGRNLRIGRRSLPGQIYLITVVTEGRLPLFADFALGRLVVQSLHYVHQNGRAATLAFVVMPDHFHWLMQLANNETLPRVIRSLKTHTAREINRKHDARGALWQAGYHDHAVRQEEDLREIARYLIANPCAPESYPLSAITRCGTRCGCGAPMIGVRVLAIGNNRGRESAPTRSRGLTPGAPRA